MDYILTVLILVILGLVIRLERQVAKHGNELDHIIKKLEGVE